jgi:hypothetical protein
MEDRITLKEFTTIYNDQRSKMNPPRHKVTFSLMKSKVIKKRKDSYVADENGVPKIVGREEAVSKVVEDTNGKTKLFQALWDYYIGTQLKRISSEGNYRHGIGFVKSSNKGFSDLHGIDNGKPFYIEVKRLNESHLKSQIKFAKFVTDGGGYYLTAITFDDMFDIVQIILSRKYELLDKYKAVSIPVNRKLNNLFD